MNNVGKGSKTSADKVRRELRENRAVQIRLERSSLDEIAARLIEEGLADPTYAKPGVCRDIQRRLRRAEKLREDDAQHLRHVSRMRLERLLDDAYARACGFVYTRNAKGDILSVSWREPTEDDDRRFLRFDESLRRLMGLDLQPAEAVTENDLHALRSRLFSALSGPEFAAARLAVAKAFAPHVVAAAAAAQLPAAAPPVPEDGPAN